MDFVESQEMKVKLNEEDRAQLSSPEKIFRALKNREALAFDIFERGDLIGFVMVRPFVKHDPKANAEGISVAADMSLWGAILMYCFHVQAFLIAYFSPIYCKMLAIFIFLQIMPTQTAFFVGNYLLYAENANKDGSSGVLVGNNHPPTSVIMRV